MKILLLLILSIFFYSPLTTSADAPKTPIICNMVGHVRKSTYTFNKDELPERCDIFQIGQYSFDLCDGNNTYMFKEDIESIKSLVESNKIVYVFFGFVSMSKTENKWATLFEPKDNEAYKKQIFDPLITFLKAHIISGISINFQDIYNTKIENLDQKIFDFVTSIKKEIPSLKVGIIIPGSAYENYSNESLFDFKITNEILDHYAILLSILNECNEETKNTGVNPITSTNEKTISLEEIEVAVCNSSMDKSKIYAMLQAYIMMPFNSAKPECPVATYSEYCASPDVNITSKWCKDSSKTIYDQGVFAKKSFAGLMVANLDTDDYNRSCCCQQFPVTNMIIDGWNSCTFTACPKLDNI